MSFRLAVALSALLLIGFPVLLPSFASGDDVGGSEPTIERLVVEVADGQITASFRLDGLFDDAFRRRLASGLPTDVVYRWVLERDRRAWFDTSRAEGRWQVVALYNAVTEEYRIDFKRDGELVSSRVVRELDVLRAAMTEITVPVVATDGLDPDERLSLRVRAELGTRTVLLFIPRTRATDWHESRRFRLAGLVDPPGGGS